MAKMDVSFYINTSPTNKVNKALGEAVKTISVDIPDNVDVVNPVLIIDDSKNEGILPSEVNYFTCGSPLDRKYFITAMDYTNAKRVIVAGHVDVLSTYHGFLENTTLNYVRGAGDPTEMDDVSYPISDYMIEQYFPMETWTDIFSSSASGRRYLLRTVCTEAESRIPTTLSDGNVFCDGNQWYEDGNGNIQYICYQFVDRGQDFVPTFAPRQDLTGIPVVFDGQFVECNGHLYRWNSFPRNSEIYSNFVYLP